MTTKKQRIKAPKRWCFMKDDDGHLYLLPADLSEQFSQMLEDSTDLFGVFIDTFEQYRLGVHFSRYSFIDPRPDQ